MRYIDTTGCFAHPRYRGVRMLPDDGESSCAERESRFVRRPIKVFNARERVPAPSLADNGFTLLRSRTGARDLYDKETVTRVFFPECAALVEQLTGCESTRILQIQYRNQARAEGMEYRNARLGRTDPYETKFHMDASAEAEFALDAIANGQHFRIYTLWRSADLENNIRMMPLALCDINSLNSEDMVYAGYFARRNPPRKRYSYRLIHNVAQRWYYFPDMTPEEVLIHKQYDTLCEQLNLRGVPHGAVEDPASPVNFPSRETVEVRVLARFGKETDKLARLRRFHADIPD